MEDIFSKEYCRLTEEYIVKINNMELAKRSIEGMIESEGFTLHGGEFVDLEVERTIEIPFRERGKSFVPGSNGSVGVLSDGRYMEISAETGEILVDRTDRVYFNMFEGKQLRRVHVEEGEEPTETPDLITTNLIEGRMGPSITYRENGEIKIVERRGDDVSHFRNDDTIYKIERRGFFSGKNIVAVESITLPVRKELYLVPYLSKDMFIFRGELYFCRGYIAHAETGEHTSLVGYYKDVFARGNMLFAILPRLVKVKF